MTEEECVAIGGHCYEMENYVLTSDPPQYDRTCKHCGKQQRGRAQESIDWHDR